eukprot:6004290-Prorocentrum_lima.AAC.1
MLKIQQYSGMWPGISRRREPIVRLQPKRRSSRDNRHIPLTNRDYQQKKPEGEFRILIREQRIGS